MNIWNELAILLNNIFSKSDDAKLDRLIQSTPEPYQQSRGFNKGSRMISAQHMFHHFLYQ